ncbi:putative FtsJ like methyltransferase [Trypanosoma vivax]|nr:rRNA methyltransferase [Trypanosoma vivax]KAH8617682.1 putative FtsJ like methyltransferase [Trypanosoma vivax]
MRTHARSTTFRCRSAYKLLELDESLNIFTDDCRTVVDLAAAPGGFSQVALQRMRMGSGMNKLNPLVVAVDRRSIEPLSGLCAIKCDINHHSSVVRHVVDALKQETGAGNGGRHVDVVLHDGVSVGRWQSAFSVTYGQNQMVMGALRLACSIFQLSARNVLGQSYAKRELKSLVVKGPFIPSTTFVTKVMHSVHFNLVLAAVEECFHSVTVKRPAQCHSDSRETFIVARGLSNFPQPTLTGHFPLLSLPPQTKDVLPGRQITWRCWGCLSNRLGTAPCMNCSQAA